MILKDRSFQEVRYRHPEGTNAVTSEIREKLKFV